jgi:hypothetical protein
MNEGALGTAQFRTAGRSLKQAAGAYIAPLAMWRCKIRGCRQSMTTMAPASRAVQEPAALAIPVAGPGLLIPMKVGTDSGLIPGSDSDVIPGVFGAKRRWPSYRA